MCDRTFRCNAGAIPNNTLLFFLPGDHTLQIDALETRFYGENNHLTFSGLSETDSIGTTINCVEGRVRNGKLIFKGFNIVTIKNLQLNDCWVVFLSNNRLIIDYAIFNDTQYEIFGQNSNSITNSQLIDYTYETAFTNIILHSTVTFQNVSIRSFNTPREYFLLNCFSSHLTFSDGSFIGSGITLVRLSSSILRTSGTVMFTKGSPAILALNSTVNLAGSVSFVDNSAFRGAAIFISESRVIIADNSQVVFQGNHAEHVGGAIFSTGRDISNYVLFGKSTELCQMSFGNNSRVLFSNNTADSYGSAIYGVSVSSMLCDSGFDFYRLFDTLVFDPDEVSAVSSDPLRVCICLDQSTPDCLAILPDQNTTQLHYTVYPGQNFTIPAIVVGFNFAFTNGPVYAQFIDSDPDNLLGSETQYLQGASRTGCTPLQYSVLTDRKEVTLVLTTVGRTVSAITEISSQIKQDISDQNNAMFIVNPDEYYLNGTFVTTLTDNLFRMAGSVKPQLQDVPVFVLVSLLDCPAGFTLSSQPHRCVCNERILKSHLTCNITDQTVNRKDTIWISVDDSSGFSGVIVHEHCPFSYCKQESVDVDLTNPDTQCANDRSGTLCGACKPNFSLALGGSQCLPNCSNRYLSLLIPFALAGFALVLFIKILNLTVSQGTINGLIFYANIVAANRSIFFPMEYSKFLSFLFIFNSWLNLDLGIDTCFIKGLDGYGKTWLQFVFPFYVWAIAGAIILFSRYSSRVTKMAGNNSVSVLATLFLLSYGKLLRLFIDIFAFSKIVYADSTKSAVWAFDGNLWYFSPKHIPLFLFALAIVLLLWLPYTAVLLSAQWLRTQTHHKRLRWLKPFLDAYYGPFKDKHHYWVGVLLVVRGVLFVFFVSFFAIEDNVNLLLINIVCLSLPTYTSSAGRLYKKRYLSILEDSFFLNLGVLAAGTLYIRLVGGNQEALVTISLVVVFLQFLGIVVFHGYYYLILPALIHYREKYQSKRQNSIENSLIPVVDIGSNVSRSELCLEDLEHQLLQDSTQKTSTSASTAEPGSVEERESRSEDGNTDVFPKGKKASQSIKINFAELREPLLSVT